MSLKVNASSEVVFSTAIPTPLTEHEIEKILLSDPVHSFALPEIKKYAETIATKVKSNSEIDQEKFKDYIGTPGSRAEMYDTFKYLVLTDKIAFFAIGRGFKIKVGFKLEEAESNFEDHEVITKQKLLNVYRYR